MDDEEREHAALTALAQAGASFAFVHGSRAWEGAGTGSDLDVAAYWDERPPAAFQVDLPDWVDLLVLNTAALELAGRVALHGRLLFETDPTARIAWQATTRKVYLDEKPRLERAHREYLAEVARGR